MSGTKLFDEHLEHNTMGAIVASVATAAECGLLQALDETPRTAEALAAPLSLDGFACTRVLDVLTMVGLAEREGDGYRVATRHAGERDPVMGLARAIELWRDLPRFLREGTGTHFTGRSSERESAYASAVDSLGRLFGPLAQQLAESSPAVPGQGRVLDVGAGSGIWSLAMAQHDPRVKVTAFDLPKVTKVFEANAARRALSDRVAVHPGDYHDDVGDLPGYDRVVLANVLHLENEDDGAAVVDRFARGLQSGGDVVIVDALPDDTPRSRLHTAAYALHLALRTGRGQVHPEPRLRQWLAAAGLTHVTRVGLGEGGMAALVARHA